MTKKQEKKGRKEASAGGVNSIHHPGIGVEQRGLVSPGFQIPGYARSDKDSVKYLLWSDILPTSSHRYFTAPSDGWYR